MKRRTKAILATVIIVFVVLIAIPISVAAVTSTDALTGLATSISGILDAQKQAGADIISLYTLFLEGVYT